MSSNALCVCGGQGCFSARVEKWFAVVCFAAWQSSQPKGTLSPRPGIISLCCLGCGYHNTLTINIQPSRTPCETQALPLAVCAAPLFLCRLDVDPGVRHVQRRAKAKERVVCHVPLQRLSLSRVTTLTDRSRCGASNTSAPCRQFPHASGLPVL